MVGAEEAAELSVEDVLRLRPATKTNGIKMWALLLQRS